MNINYITEIQGNEAVVDKFIVAVEAGNCTVSKDYPNPLILPSGEQILSDRVLIRYLDLLVPFDSDKAAYFTEKMRKLVGLDALTYRLDMWIAGRLKPFYKSDKYFNLTNIRDDRPPEGPETELLEYICLIGVLYTKFGPSYISVRVNQLFEAVTELGGGKIVNKLKKEGTGTLSSELTSFKDENVTCRANDAFGIVDITIKNETEAAYRQAILFVNRLLATDFPKSYQINFKTKTKSYLPVRGLPKKGANAFFSNLSRYPALFDEVSRYVMLNNHKDEWYTDINEEICTKTGTYAAIMLVLQSDKYFPVYMNYLKSVDDEHQEVHTNATPMIIEKYGINGKTLPLFISIVFSCQAHKPNKLYAEQFSTVQNLTELLGYKGKLCTLLEWDDYGDGFEQYLWDALLYTIWGKAKDAKTALKQISDPSKDVEELYKEIWKPV